MPTHVPRVSYRRGQVIYSCSCGWMGKKRDTIAKARRLFDRHLDETRPNYDLRHAGEGR